MKFGLGEFEELFSELRRTHFVPMVKMFRYFWNGVWCVCRMVVMMLVCCVAYFLGGEACRHELALYDTWSP